MRRESFLAVIGIVLAVAGGGHALDQPLAPVIAEVLAGVDPLVVGGDYVHGPSLRAVYEGRAHAPAWTEAQLDALTAAFSAAADHGLDPAVYHLAPIAARRTGGGRRAAAELDVLATDALMRYGADVHAGRLAPTHRDDEVDLEPRSFDPVAVVAAAASANDLTAFLAGLPPKSPEYERSKELLHRYREIARRGGWPAIPDGPKLEVGASGPAVTVLAERLAATGDLAERPEPTARFDAELRAAVERFQQRHGLVADGVVGAATRAALNVDVATRIDQIAANLERRRWLPDDLGARHVVVNVAGFTLELVEGGRTVLDMPVVVGRRDRTTPIVASQITRVTFNPNWTVPETIARKDMLGRVRRNAAYFASEGIRVYAGPRGARHEIDPATVNWAESGISEFLLRQPPGPGNPLGRVRFDFPNANAVYLHDSPQRSYFQRPVRALSSGCVRLGKALELADRLLAGGPGWDEERRAAMLAGWRTRYVSLPSPVPLYIVYRTAWLDDAGTAQFRDDVYGRDRRLAEALRYRKLPPARQSTRREVVASPAT